MSQPFPRYLRKGKCLRCGWCCLQENPPCTHLSFDKKGIATCSIHNGDRPVRCGLFPEMPPILNPKCGYYFVDRWDSGRRIKGKEDLER